MSTFTIGRIGVDTSAGGDGTSFQHPFDWQQQGRMVTLQGLHQASTDSAAVWLQQQIIGLDPANNPDEEWVPLTSSTVSELNGFFRVASASAVIPQGSLGTGTRLVQWQVQLERAPAWRRPRIDLPTVYAGVTNGMGVTVRMDGQSLPTDTVERWGLMGASYTVTRASEHGTVDYRYYDGNAVTYVLNVPTTASWAPGTHYSGSSYIERVNVGKVVGRLDAPVSDGYRVSNGLVRIQPDTGGTTLTFQFWNGSAWTGTKSFNFESYGGTATDYAMRRVTVLRNDPTECVLRVWMPSQVAGWTTMDLAVRRGERFCRLFVTGEGISQFTLKFSSNTACTSTTWGVRTSSTVNGQHIVLVSDYGTNKGTPGTNGSLALPVGSTRTTMSFGIGASGSSTTGNVPDGADSVAKQYFAAVGETQRVAF